MVIAGLIRPPPEIRAVADRTALFVSKNGRAFELKILNSEKGKTPKFAFLHESSPFHAYYEDRIRFYEEGGTDEEEKRREEELKEKERARAEEEERAREEAERAKKKRETAKMKASAVDPVARALLRGRAKIEEGKRTAISRGDDEENYEPTGPTPPPPLNHVSLAAPANLTPLEVETIKLTAQYVALSSRGDTSSKRDNFLSNLTLREWTNPQFMFLQPRHAHFAYFTALVDGYRSFLPGGEDYEMMKVKGKKERLAHLMTEEREQKSKESVVGECLEAAAYRTEYEREASNRKREAIERAAGGSVLGGAGTIDWHDFVVVATIEFAEDEVVEALPPPTSLRLAVMTKEVASEKPEEKAEEDDEMDESEEGSDMEEEDEGEEQLKVVANYQPKVVSTKEITGDSSRTHIIDPITGKSIAIADMSEHMRIQLLDPKWAEERKRFAEKQRETNYVAGEDISANISRLAQARGDLFGVSQAELDSQKVDSEKRLMEANQLIRNQAMQGPALPGAPPAQMMAPVSVAAPPPPPPPPQPIATQPADGEPAAKRAKIEEPQMNLAPSMMVPPAPPMLAVPGLPPPPMPPQFDPNAAVPPIPPPPLQQQQQAILPEEEFIATLDSPNEIYFCVLIPHDPSNSNWNFNGQTIDVTLGAKSKIKELKEYLKGQLGGMPINKMQLRHPVSGFMNKDALTLGHFNVGPGMTLDLVPKTRGGRK